MIGKVLIKDMAKYFLIVVIPMIARFIFIPIISCLFPPAVYGNYVLVITTVTVLLSLLSFIPGATVRFYPAFERDGRLDEFISTFVKFLFICTVVICFICIGILLFYKAIMPNILYKLMFLGLLVFILKANSGLFVSLFRASRQANRYAIFSIWDGTAPIIFGVIFVLLFGFGIDGLLWGAIIAAAIAFPLLWVFTIKRDFLKANISADLILEFTKYGLPLLIQDLLFSVIMFSDRYMLSFFQNQTQVGIYSLSYLIGNTGIMALTSPFRLADRPITIHAWEKEGLQKSQEYVSKFTRYYFIICLPVAVGLSVLAKPIMYSLVAESYHEGYQIIPFVVFAYFFLGIADRFGAGIDFYKKSHLLMFCTIIASLTNVTLNLLLIPRYGYISAAITILITYSVYSILVIVISRKIFTFHFSFKSLGKIAIASGAMGAITYYIGNMWNKSMIINFIAAICIGIPIYFSILFLLREIGWKEIRKGLGVFS